MSDDLTTELERRLEILADGAPTAPLEPDTDLRRGRRGLARRRAAVGAVALATAGVVTVAALGITGGSDEAGPDPLDGPAPTSTATDSATPSPSPTPSETPRPVDRRNGKQVLTSWAEALASHLDPEGRHLETKVTGYQGGGGLGTKLGWSVEGQSGLGLVQIFVGRDAFRGSFTGYTCGAGSPKCEEVTVDGVTMRVQRAGGTTGIYHVQPDGDRVFLFLDPLFGNNSTVPLANLDFPLRTLAAAVSDPAFTTPTAQQVRGAGKAFGFPDFG